MESSDKYSIFTVTAELINILSVYIVPYISRIKINEELMVSPI